ncbi:MAG: PAS domain S-box protein [Deltaproteobacteria bacterium]|nr:PAS domain S-box protein [Deltaproteobacteria bacterium]
MAFPRNQHLVLMPGLDGTGKSFEPLLPLIADDNRVTVVSYPADRILSFEETVESAARQIPDDIPPVVIAESFSGPVAVRMIASGRVKAQALVLCATFARPPHPFIWRIVHLLRLPIFIRPLTSGSFFNYVMGDPRQAAALRPLWEKVHAAVPPHVLASRLSLLNRVDVTRDLRRLDIPCLYLQATDDRIVPANCLSVFERNLAYLTVKKIKAPHFILQSAPETCLAAIDELLGRMVSNPPGETTEALRREIADLRKSEAFFRTINQDSSDITIIVDSRAIITYVNPSIEKFLGYRPEELIGKSGFDYISPDDLPRALLEFGKSILTRETKIANAFKIRHKEGSIHVLEGVGVNLLYNPIVRGFVMNVRDITDRRKIEEELGTYRKHLEEMVAKRTAALSLTNAQLLEQLTEREEMQKALKASEEKYRDFIDNAPIGVAIVDLEGKVQFVNKKIEQIMGWSRDEIIGKNGFGLEVFDDQARQSMLERFQARVKGDPPQIFEMPIKTIKGDSVWVEVITTILRKDGAPVGAQMVFVNLNERKRAEEERKALIDRLHQAEKMESLGTMAGGIAHELNNVLSVLIGYTELVLIKTTEDDPLKKHLNGIMKSSEKATAIIHDMLTLARRNVAVSDIVNINRILTDYFQTAEFQHLGAAHPRITFKQELATDLPDIYGSPANLKKAFINLIESTVDSAGEEGEITVGTGQTYLDQPLPGHGDVREGRYAVLTVGNNGRSVSPVDAKKIFEPFYTKKVMGRGGTGLELAVVWGIVREHEGYVDFQSESGKGSIFTVYLPVIRDK